MSPRTRSDPASAPGKATIGVIAAVVVAVYGVVGFLFKGSVTPLVIDKMFGVSNYVAGQIAKNIDAGYSRTFLFTDAWQGEPTLLFYSTEEQKVTVSIAAALAEGAVDSLTVYMDGSVWRRFAVPRQDRSELAVPAHLIRGDYYGGNLHELKVVLGAIPPQTRLYVECLVLVANR